MADNAPNKKAIKETAKMYYAKVFWKYSNTHDSNSAQN